MAKVIVILKAILTRVLFGGHGFIAIWRVTLIKEDPYYWYLTASILALAFEGIFTLTIKKNQEWKWFCPSVFFYLCSVVPAIWLIEVDKFDKKFDSMHQLKGDVMAAGGIILNSNLTAVFKEEGVPGLKNIGVDLKIPIPQLDDEMWVTVIEQFLMLILIIGRWMLPKGGLTRDQLSQLLLVYIGTAADIIEFFDSFKVDLKIPIPQLDDEMWVTVIEQFLMLILIIGRWMLPKGGLTRDQLSQLLLVYIGTAADIIEFFDSFKDEKISGHRILCLLILSIWSWSLLQFTFVLTATKARRTRISTDVKETPKLKLVNGIIKVKEVCCNIDVWAILINIILQDAPFLIFRALLILYYKIISYMNIFFTAKNTLVIILQFYRLYVVQQDKNKELSKIQKAAVSKNVANAVERAARMGPEGRARLVKNAASGKRSSKGPSSKQAQNKNKHRSQDSISSQNTNISSSRRNRNGRRRSLSTGNLPEVGEDETFEDRIYEDDIELGMSGSALSGTNDPDSQEEDEESEAPLDEVSVTSERPRAPRKNIRMSENPGIYKISGSRSSGSSERGHGRYRQDTGYSSSSKDSGNSGGQRRQGRPQQSHGGGGGGRSSGRPVPNSRSRSTAQRRRQFISTKYCNSIEIGDYEGMLLDQLGVSIEDPDPMLDNERLWQRRVAIGAVFFIFVVIFILCMVAIYGGINPKGLVLRENFRIGNTTRPTTTTPKPTTEIGSTRNAVHNKSVIPVSPSTGGVFPAASVSPVGGGGDAENYTVEQSNLNLTDSLNETIDNFEEHSASNYDNISFNDSSTFRENTVDTFMRERNDAVETSTDRNVEYINVTISTLSKATDKANPSIPNSNINGHVSSAGDHHHLRHRMSRILKFASEVNDDFWRSKQFWKLSRGMSSFK